MTSVIDNYQYIIEQLVPVVQAPDFDELFKAMTSEISKPHQFQLKMEINRLKAPSPRIVDLRGHVQGTVSPHEYDDKTHYFDPLALEVFERGIRHYGSFTVGVFEEVNATENNFRVLHQKEQKERLADKEEAEKRKKKEREQRKVATPQTLVAEEEEEDLTLISYNANMVQFQSYAIRSEERMNYSIAIEVQMTADETIKATSSDLSVSGCKAKLPHNVEVQPGQLLRLHFRGLETEFALGLSKGIEYEVVASEMVDAAQYVRMKRTYSDSTVAFDEFLNNFINGNKRRYKVNMENTEEAVIIKGYEQYYVPRITSLPVFINHVNDQYSISAILTTENNKQTMRYWFNEEQQMMLCEVFKHKRIKLLLDTESETVLYSFTHTRNGRISHYAALHQELQKDDQLRQLFFGFGAKKNNWRVHKIQLLNASYDTAHIPLSLPDSAGEDIKQLNRPPSARVQSVVGNTAAILVLTDITELQQNKQYQSFKYNIKTANNLKVYGVARPKEPSPLEIVAVDYVNLRKETRFLYRTKATIELPPESPVNGFTRDFSTKGIQIELDAPCNIEKGEIVLISLPEMQKITRKFKLTRLPYEAVAISKNKKIINVRINEHGDKHNGRKFFQQLIQTNRSKLTAAEEMQTIPGLPLAMRNMFVHVCSNMPFYIHRKGIRYMLNTVGRGGQNNSLHELMSHFSEPSFDYHLQPLIKGNLIDTLFASVLKSMKRQDAPQVRELLIRLRRDKKDVESAIDIEFSKDLRTDQSHHEFIQGAIAGDLFFAYRIYISRTGRPDIDYISKELKYVGNYAIHRAKVLEEELWGVIGVADAIDITEEMLIRYGYSDTDIQIQQQAKEFYFTKTIKDNA